MLQGGFYDFSFNFNVYFRKECYVINKAMLLRRDTRVGAEVIAFSFKKRDNFLCPITNELSFSICPSCRKHHKYGRDERGVVLLGQLFPSIWQIFVPFEKEFLAQRKGSGRHFMLGVSEIWFRTSGNWNRERRRARRLERSYKNRPGSKIPVKDPGRIEIILFWHISLTGVKEHTTKLMVRLEHAYTEKKVNCNQYLIQLCN